MGIKVFTDGFEAAHGKKPRGYGSWGFTFGDGRGAWLREVFWVHASNYGAARAEAVRRCRAEGCCLVAVCS